MRTIPATILQLACLLSFPFAGIGAPADSTKEIGSFSTGLDSWVYNGGWEFKGATGRASRVTEEGHDSPGAMKLSAEFTAGGSYVALMRQVEPTPLGELKFWVKPEGITGLDVRLTDSGGQTFEYEVSLSDGDEWREVTVSPQKDTPKSQWGGVNDGKWGGDVQAVWIMISRRFCGSAKAGACLIDDIHLAQP